MGLVDYDSDSGSSDDGGVPAAPPAKPAAATATGKKPFQKLVDRAHPGKILVNLPTAAAAAADDEDERPAKRAKIGAAAAGGSRFSGFGSSLPPPKKAAAGSSAVPTAATTTAAATSSHPRPGVHLKTSAEAAFSRGDDDDSQAAEGSSNGPRSSMSLPPPKAAAAAAKGPSVPKDQKAAEDVKLVGNPLMFMPLSVSRKPGKKKAAKGVPKAQASGTSGTSVTPGPSRTPETPETAPAPPPKKISLFSLGTDDPAEAAPVPEAAADGAYQPMFETTYGGTQEQPEQPYEEQPYEQQQQEQQQQQHQPPSATSLDALADDLQLSAKERRELFGRGAAGAHRAVTTFNLDQEYRSNERMRQAGELDAQQQQQQHNPVRAIMPGKHSLRQLVQQVHNQRDALEESFAQNRVSQRESGGKYGWR